MSMQMDANLTQVLKLKTMRVLKISKSYTVKGCINQLIYLMIGGAQLSDAI